MFVITAVRLSRSQLVAVRSGLPEIVDKTIFVPIMTMLLLGRLTIITMLLQGRLTEASRRDSIKMLGEKKTGEKRVQGAVVRKVG